MSGLSRRFFMSSAGISLSGNKLFHCGSVQMFEVRSPTVDTDNITEITDGVFVIGDHRVRLVPNIGIVLGSEAALVIDTGLGPINGEAVLAVAQRIAGPQRRLLVTLTHFHPEHGFGLQAFCHDATIIYNRAQRDELVEKGEKYLALFRQIKNSAVVAALDGTIITFPHIVYDGSCIEMDLGDRKIELRTYGPAHTRGDQSIFLPRERILFAGDLFSERAFTTSSYILPIDGEVNGIRWATILRGFRALNPCVIVPGHGDLCGI